MSVIVLNLSGKKHESPLRWILNLQGINPLIKQIKRNYNLGSFTILFLILFKQHRLNKHTTKLSNFNDSLRDTTKTVPLMVEGEEKVLWWFVGSLITHKISLPNINFNKAYRKANFRSSFFPLFALVVFCCKRHYIIKIILKLNFFHGIDFLHNNYF